MAEKNEGTLIPKVLITCTIRLARNNFTWTSNTATKPPTLSPGIHSIKRWVRPFSYQDWPNNLLPDELKNENPLQISRVVNGSQTTKSI